ncbi:MAG: hypothetical protein PHQ75_14340, partial [Thermoguttaceae bacterium]|nr:hypothetical protein [Thermoguttaceae bacterium]
MRQSYTPPKKWSPRLLAGLVLSSVIISLIILFFYPVLFKDRQFAFRDDVFFYIPIFEQIQEYYHQGEFPLWDPDTNLGQPLAANPATSIYYPVKLVFFLSWLTPLSFHSCYKIYTLFHVVWGMCGMYLMMRRFKCSRGASLISTIAYMFAGSVIILYCNIIFLIGAAWIPWIVLCGDRLLRSPGVGRFLIFTLTLALTVLGGDPQTAYCIGMALVAMALIYWRTGLLDRPQTQADSLHLIQAGTPTAPNHVNMPARATFKVFLSRFGILLLSAIVAGLLAAVQIIPANELARHSDRTLCDMQYSIWDVPPGSIWEIPGYLRKWNAFPPGKTPEKIAANRPASRMTGILNGLLCRQLSEGGHANVIYSFSVMPYHFVDLLWPYFGGRSIPENGKWDPYAVGWFHSMYMGAFVFLLALTAARIRLKKPAVPRNNADHQTGQSSRGSLRRAIAVWSTWTAVITALASLGGYGPCWCWRVLAARGNTPWLVGDGDPVGGLYWFFSVFLPGFGSFRYPAKMIVLTSFALAILAGIGWDCCRTKKLLLKLCSWSIWLSLFALCFVCASGVRLFERPITP